MEPYTTSFYCKIEGEPWVWFYMDHEDTRWFSGRIDYNKDTKIAEIYHGNDLVAKYDSNTGTFTRGTHSTQGTKLSINEKPGDKL